MPPRKVRHLSYMRQGRPRTARVKNRRPLQAAGQFILLLLGLLLAADDNYHDYAGDRYSGHCQNGCPYADVGGIAGLGVAVAVLDGDNSVSDGHSVQT